MKKKLMLIIVVILLVVFVYTRNQSTSIAEYLENKGFDYNSIDEISIVQSGYNWSQEEDIRLVIDAQQGIEYLMSIKDIRLKRNKRLLKSNDIYWNQENDVSIISISATSNTDTIRLAIYNSEDGDISIRLHQGKLQEEVLYFSNFEDFIIEK